MKVIIYMAPTPNGLIASPNDDTSFVSANDWKLFERKVNDAGNVVIGRRTHEVCVRENVFPIGSALNIVMTRKAIKNRWGGRVIFTSKSPKEILKLLRLKGFAVTIVAGGAHVNASFLKSNLVDEIHLDVQPKILGRGISLFAEGDFNADLKLLGTTKTSKNEVQLRYRVLKKKRA